MNQDKAKIIKEEKEIPADVLQKLQQNRTQILAQTIPQEIQRYHIRKPILFGLTLVAIAALFLTHPQVNTAIKKALGISQDPAVAVVENSGIDTELSLVSESSGIEITLTKFVSTKQKVAFDYHFTMSEELKALIEKNERISNPVEKKSDFIQFDIFEQGGDTSLMGGCSMGQIFRVEGDTYYGSGFAIFDTDTIPEGAKIELRIQQLAWLDNGETLEQMEAAQAIGPSEPFGVANAIEYNGNWSFDVDYEPLMATATPTIRDSQNLSNITIKSDALQTTAKFTVPEAYRGDPESLYLPYRCLVPKIYKNGVELENFINRHIGFLETGEIEIGFDFSALDQTGDVYRVQLNEEDHFGGIIGEIGYFEFVNE